MSNSDFAQLLESAEGLTEQFKTNASQLFEQAVETRANQLVEQQLEAEKQKLIEQAKADAETEIRESVTKEFEEKYQWMVQTNERLNESLNEQSEKHEQELKAKQEECDAIKKECDDKIAKNVEECDKKVQEVEESLDDRAAQLSVEKVEALRDRLAGYADYVAEQYVAENHDEIVTESKSMIAEGILDTIRECLASYGLGVEEGHQAYEHKIRNLMNERDQAYANLAEAVEAKFDAERELAEHLKSEAFDEITEGLTSLDRERIKNLLAEDTSDVETYKSRVKTLAESFAHTTTKEHAPAVSTVNVVTESVPKQPEAKKTITENVDSDVAFFVSALSSGKADHF